MYVDRKSGRAGVCTSAFIAGAICTLYLQLDRRRIYDKNDCKKNCGLKHREGLINFS